MLVDDCAHDFAALSLRVLPGYLETLRADMQWPMVMADFAVAKVGVRTLLKRRGRTDDFSGCYVFMTDVPQYVGISRSVFTRLRNHVLGRTHYQATLAYRMAALEHARPMSRNEAMREPAFLDLFNLKRSHIQSMRVATVEIQNPLELYLFEVYAAMKLKTSVWNSFRTH